MDENNNVVEQNKNNQKIIKYIIVIVLLIVVGVTCFIIGSMSNKQNKNNNIEEQEENNTEKDNSKNNENVQSLTDEEKIMKFVIVGLETRNIGESNESFIKGYSKPLTIYDKIKITLTQLIIIEEKFQVLDTVPSNYIAKYDKKYDINEYDFYELKVKDFKKVYKDLFNEDVNFDLKEINSDKIGSQTCPYILGLSNDESIGFLLAGYSNGGDQEIILINVDCGNVENPVELNKDDPLAVLWFGDTDFITRYLLGFDERLSIILKNNNVDDDVIEDIISNCKDDLQLPLGVPAMPIQDAIDLVRFLADISVNSSRFVPGAQVIGGSIDIAVITKHEGFKWISRKHYYNQNLNITTGGK